MGGTRTWGHNTSRVSLVKACVWSTGEAEIAVLRLFETQLTAVLMGSLSTFSVHVPILGLFILPPGWGYPENHLPLTQRVRANAPDKRKPTQNLCTYRRFARQVKDYVFPEAWVA